MTQNPITAPHPYKWIMHNRVSPQFRAQFKIEPEPPSFCIKLRAKIPPLWQTLLTHSPLRKKKKKKERAPRNTKFAGERGTPGAKKEARAGALFIFRRNAAWGAAVHSRFPSRALYHRPYQLFCQFRGGGCCSCGRWMGLLLLLH